MLMYKLSIFIQFFIDEGITKLSSMEYIVGTLNGHLECLRLKIVANTITVESEELKQPNGHSKYSLYGLASSMNNAFLLGAYFAGRVSSMDRLLFLD